MADANLIAAIAEVKRAYTTTRLTRNVSVPQSALDTILNAILSGDLIPRADADLAVAEAIRRAGEIADGYHRRAIEWVKKVRGLDQHIDETDGSRISDDIRALAPADALAEVQRLREERDQAVRGRNEWSDDFKALAAAVVGDTGLSAMTVAAQARTFRPRAERAEAERDAALARLENLRRQITEASDPDFLFGAMDNVNDMDVTLDQFAAAASRAIRAALDEETK